MRTQPVVAVLLLLALAAPASQVQAGGVVAVCDEFHLRAALLSGGLVTFACSGVITLATPIFIAVDTTINASGQKVAISGQNATPIFVVNSAAAVRLDGLTVADGTATQGGGVRNGGTLLVNQCLFSGHVAYQGGAISNTGVLTMSHSTLADNNVMGGGALLDGHQSGVATVSNSTFYGNGAAAGGAILRTASPGALTITNCTFSANVPGIHSNGGAITLENAIVAHSRDGSNCSGPISDGGGNLSYPDASCPGIDADPLLGPLQDNGGLTWTMALGEGSAALDKGDDAICAAPPVNSLDQRGFPRPWGAHCDIGAVEQVQQPAAVHLGTLSASSLPATVSPTLFASLLLAALAGFGVRRRRPTAG